MVLVFTAFLEVRGSVEKLLKRLAFTFFLSQLKQRIETPSQFSHQNEGFIDYVSSRNWAVRNSAGTRLDSSSLVNKLVVTTCEWLLLGMRVKVYLKGNFYVKFLIHTSGSNMAPPSCECSHALTIFFVCENNILHSCQVFGFIQYVLVGGIFC